MSIKDTTEDISVYATLTDYQLADYPDAPSHEEFTTITYELDLYSYGPCIDNYNF